MTIWRQSGDKISNQISWPLKHFYVSKIIVRVILCCLRGFGSMSSSRRIPRFIVLFSSGHHWLFFAASLRTYVVVASFLCLRVVLPCYPLTKLPCYLVTLLPCYPVTLLPCYPVTPLPCYIATMLPCYPVTLLPCYSVALLPYSPVTLLPC